MQLIGITVIGHWNAPRLPTAALAKGRWPDQRATSRPNHKRLLLLMHSCAGPSWFCHAGQGRHRQDTRARFAQKIARPGFALRTSEIVN